MSLARTAAVALLMACLTVVSPLPAGAASDPACRDQRVIMLMTSWCPYCRKATAFFKQHDIAVLEIDIEKTDNERIRALKGQTAVPTILVGETVMEGFSESGLRRLLCIE